jgi:hypothetical protein
VDREPRLGLPADLELGHLPGGDHRSTGRGWPARSCTAGSPRSSRSRSASRSPTRSRSGGGAYKNVLLFLVIAPFFTSFLLRTISWKIILADYGLVLGPLKEIGLLPEEFRLLATPAAVIAGHHVQLPAVHDAAAVCRAREIDKRLIEAAEDLYAGRGGRRARSRAWRSAAAWGWSSGW